MPGRAREGCLGGWPGCPGRCLGGCREVPGGAWEVPGGAWRSAWEAGPGCREGCTGPPLHWRLVGMYSLLGTPTSMAVSPATGDMPEVGASR